MLSLASPSCLTDLPAEVLDLILSHLSPSDLSSLSLVNKYLNTAVMDDSLWRRMTVAPKLSDISPKRLIPPTSFNPDGLDWQTLFLLFGQLGDEAEQYPLVMQGLAASSTDDSGNTDQTISKTIKDDSNFWSSTGSPGPDYDEWLLYSLVQPVCIVTSVEISPFPAHFQYGGPIYGSKQAQVRIGFSVEDFHYESEIFDLENTEHVQTVTIKPTLVLGGYVFIRLIGKYAIQATDQLYYTAIRMVVIWGIPLGMVLDDSFRFSLLQYALSFPQFKDFATRTYLHNSKSEARLCVSDTDVHEVIAFFQKLLREEMRDTNSYAKEREIVITQLRELLRTASWDKVMAFILYRHSSKIATRCTEILDVIMEEKGPLFVLQYFGHNYIFTASESGFLARLTVSDYALTDANFCAQARGRLYQAYMRHQLKCTKEVGTYVEQYDKELALMIYSSGHICSKMLELSVELGRFDHVVAVSSVILVDFKILFSQIRTHWAERRVYETALRIAEEDQEMRSWAAICAALGGNFANVSHLPAELRTFLASYPPEGDS